MKRAEPLVSIALCTYNGERFLSKQLDSLLAQLHTNLEIVAVDDCSSDKTFALLESYEQRDARLRIARNSSNVGFALNFANALRLCRGEFIAPCDQDDIWLPEKLSALLDVIGDKPLAYCDSTYIDANDRPLGRKLSDKMPMKSTDDPLSLLLWNFVPGHTMLVRRELVTQALPIPPSFGFYDWWLATVAAISGGLVFRNECLVSYRQHDRNVTESLWRVPDEKQLLAGHRIRELRGIGERLASLAALNHQQPSIVRLNRLWHARERQWISPQLALFMLAYRRRIFVHGDIVGWRRVRRCARFFWGIKMKRLLNRHAYA